MKTAGGLILLPVMLALVLIAFVALMLSRTGSVGTATLAATELIAEASYVAEAGLNHAIARTNASACTVYGLPSTAFGAHTYAATYTPASGSPVRIDATGTLADGSRQTLSRRVHFVAPGATHTLYLYSGLPGAGNTSGDTYIASGLVDMLLNFSAESTIRLTQTASKDRRGLIKFDLTGLGTNTTIDDAVLELTRNSTDGSVAIGVHRMTSDWVPSLTTWLLGGNLLWGTAGGDFEATPVASANISPGAPVRVSWSSAALTSLVAQWVADPSQNFGLMLKPAGTVNNAYFTACGATQSASCVALTITYRCECGTTCGLP